MHDTLHNLGLSEHAHTVYATLLRTGPTSVRKLADAAGMNRGTTYDQLKTLIDLGLVAHYQKEKRQFFAAEDPNALLALVTLRRRALDRTEEAIARDMPALREQMAASGQRTAVRSFTGAHGIEQMLRDVLTVTVALPEKLYRVYSSAKIRERLYDAFADFTAERIARAIHVRVISFGAGGEKAEHAERRWMTEKHDAPSYLLLYGEKIASISLDAHGRLHGVILDDAGAAKTQAIIFDHIWKTLPTERAS